MRVTFALAATALLAAAQIASAQNSMQPVPVPAPLKAPAPKSKVSGDPGRIVCKDTETTGSRVNRKRDCRTAQAWAEQNAVDRLVLEQQQANRGRRGE